MKLTNYANQQRCRSEEMRKLVTETFPRKDIVQFCLVALFFSGQVIKLTHFKPMFFFYTSQKRQDFWRFQGLQKQNIVLKWFHYLLFHDYRSSLQEVFCKKGVLKNFATSTEKHPCHSLFFNKVACLIPLENTRKSLVFWFFRCYKASNFIKKEILSQVFSCEFCKMFQNTFFIEYLRWLLV